MQVPRRNLQVKSVYEGHRSRSRSQEQKLRYFTLASVTQGGVLSPVCLRVVCLRLKGNVNAEFKVSFQDFSRTLKKPRFLRKSL